MEIKKILKDKEKLLDKEVIVKGWIRKHRKLKELGFIELSDGTTLKQIQIIYDQSLKSFSDIQKIHYGSSIKVKGIIKEQQLDKEQVEIIATEITLIGDCDSDYPIQPKKHTKEFLREQAYLRGRTTLYQAIFKVRQDKIIN